jgi:hypothetical protein
MVALVFVSLLLTIGAVIFAFILGIRALDLSTNHPQALSLKLIAANLFEPSVTIFVLLVSSQIFLSNDKNGLLTGILSAIPLTLMLLAPLFFRVSHPIRLTLIVYGLLRWVNTIALWVFNLMRVTVLNEPNSGGPDIFRSSKIGELDTIVGSLIIFGTLILCLSVFHFDSSLDTFKIRVEPITDSPEALKLES